jgi:hypothetical protein
MTRTRQELHGQVSNRTAMSVRSKKFGELHGYDEQLCPGCGQWKPRFYGSKMANSPGSTFTVCRECRETQADVTPWESVKSEIARKAEVRATREAV